MCNLASVALPRFVREREASGGRESKRLVGSLEAEGRYFDFEKLAEVTGVVTRNLNKIIDVNYYPVETARNSNMRHRPIGLGVQVRRVECGERGAVAAQPACRPACLCLRGVRQHNQPAPTAPLMMFLLLPLTLSPLQGLADTFLLLGLPFDSEEAAELNRAIFETIYYAALKMSMQLAKTEGPYSTYVGSPVSKGVLQPDMWGVTPSDRWDWAALRRDIAAHGVRNSLLVAPMPTASTSQILGNNECFEPYTSNIYVRRVLSGERCRRQVVGDAGWWG